MQDILNGDRIELCDFLVGIAADILEELLDTEKILLGHHGCQIMRENKGFSVIAGKRTNIGILKIIFRTDSAQDLAERAFVATGDDVNAEVEIKLALLICGNSAAETVVLLNHKDLLALMSHQNACRHAADSRTDNYCIIFFHNSVIPFN